MPFVYYDNDTLNAMLETFNYSLSINRIKLTNTKLLWKVVRSVNSCLFEPLCHVTKTLIWINSYQVLWYVGSGRHRRAPLSSELCEEISLKQLLCWRHWPLLQLPAGFTILYQRRHLINMMITWPISYLGVLLSSSTSTESLEVISASEMVEDSWPRRLPPLAPLWSISSCGKVGGVSLLCVIMSDPFQRPPSPSRAGVDWQ